ncbi:MAG: M3 family metallopeptidase [Gemmatimonadales bacterium]
MKTILRTATRSWVPVLALLTGVSATTPPGPGDDRPFWTGHPDAVAFASAVDQRLAGAGQQLDRLLAVRGNRTIDNTLRPYDKLLRELDAAGSQAGLIQEVHPDSLVRGAAEAASQRVSAFATDLSLNRPVYDALSALDLAGADAETRYYVERTLRDFRLAGVSKDEETRHKIKALSDELVLIGQEFGRNIRDGRRTVTVNDPAELDGLPPDYIAHHPRGRDGKITLTTDYPDAFPVLKYARSDDLRHRMFIEFNNRAYPENLAVLDRLIAQRAELAALLGFSNWADYITANKMVGSGKNAADFIDRIVAASAQPAAGEYQILLARKAQDVPGATRINAWESGYWSELVRRSNYNFNSQQVRPYLPYDRVKQGVLDVTSRLFGLTFRRMKDPPVWHPSVEGWEMLDRGKLVGRFYLDMHPRPGKFSHAAQFGVRVGVRGRQIPEATLVCNFPGGEEGDPGLMEHGDVRTFFHEFGHLIHHLVAGQHRWVGIGGTSTEQDFVEAPSQMLEEWIWDPATLATFAQHYQTGEPIPADLVRQMKRASDFGKALGVRQQMVYAKLSLSVYDRPPAEVNTDSLVIGLNRQYTPFPPVPEAHFQAAFGHLDGYSAVYYTYMWSLVIAKDLFSQFDKSNLLAPGVARRYRDVVLAPGGSMPAAKLVENFLGRPFNFDAWQAWLADEQ